MDIANGACISLAIICVGTGMGGEAMLATEVDFVPGTAHEVFTLMRFLLWQPSLRDIIGTALGHQCAGKA